MRETRFNAVVMFRVVNAAIAGSTKAFENLLNQLDEDYKQDVIKDAKLAGIEIEEH